jgi:alkylation response protein AidB-like acyl-CoA dehydrogenase
VSCGAIQALADAGIFKLRMPVRYGGYEADTRTPVDASVDLGRVDGALAWTVSTYGLRCVSAGRKLTLLVPGSATCRRSSCSPRPCIW